ncbi:hypothetical protein HMPREF9401_1908 [Aliarcobacter butzleri JV22]|nr:hypothetical protein [Aliarcobacter butzleri]EFU69156.1 hypothetical protein HMPREF9401_1908 [Aliarcobacter butzleri JV22]
MSSDKSIKPTQPTETDSGGKVAEFHKNKSNSNRPTKPTTEKKGK